MNASLGLRLIPALFLTSQSIQPAHAATSQYWNSGGSGGDGIWGTAPGDKNWNLSAAGPVGTNRFWQDGPDDVAVFQDAIGGIVTVFDPVQTTGIILTGADYTINASTITLIPEPTASAPFIRVVGSGAELTIDSILDGSTGLLKQGTGTLVLSSDNLYTGNTSITEGSLILTGSLSSESLSIASGAEFLDQSGGLLGTTVLTNAGTLTMGASDTVASYISNGGTLTGGAGLLSATNTALNSNSSIVGLLSTSTLISNGAVSVSGSVTAGSFELASGILTNSSYLGGPTARFNINSGAALVAGGTQEYSLLTTSGAGSGLWIGDLNNQTTVAPGGYGGFGTLDVSGDFSNAPGGTLNFDVSATGNDRINVGGLARFDGTLELNQVGSLPIVPFVPIHLVDASSYAGNITSLVENIPGAVLFNPGNGKAFVIGSPNGPNGAFGSLTPSQTSSWIALYDDVIDPGVTNISITQTGGLQYDITSGIADTSNPDLLWALDASFTPTGFNRPLLNRLSPAPYLAFEDYAIQATRTHQRTALSAPALSSRPTVHSDSKAGAKDADLNPNPIDWELFAATDFFNVDSDLSANQTDSRIKGFGFIGGARVRPTEKLQLAAYLALDDGNVKSSLINAEGGGWSLGVLGELLLEKTTETRVTAGISYGSYSFDGHRGSVSATSTGWSPGSTSFSDLTTDSLELFVNIEGIIYQDERFRVLPSAGLRYASGTLDSFAEITGAAPGAPIGLLVGADNYRSAIAEFSLLAEAEVTQQLTLQGLVGVNARLSDDQRAINARFSPNSRLLQGNSEGLSGNSVVLGLGAIHQFSDTLSAALSYRAEFRGNSDTQHGVSLSSSVRF